MTTSASTISRRAFVDRVRSALATSSVLRAQPKSDSITISVTGGSFQEILVRTVTQPFTQEAGIKVNVIPRPDMAKVKAQLLSESVAFDIHIRTPAEAAYGSKESFWEKLDLSRFDLADMPIAPTSNALVTDTYVAGVAWDPARVGAGKSPRTSPTSSTQREVSWTPGASQSSGRQLGGPAGRRRSCLGHLSARSQSGLQGP
jgi:putative spermidine/putrescine transport system substrate-binding protein